MVLHHLQTAVLVRSFSGAISSKADFTVQNFTANGSNTVYKLAETVSSGDHVLVSINGVIQRNTTDYTYNTGNGNITFDAAPTSGDIISFRTFDLQQSTSATVSDTAPTDPRNGDFWFDSSTAKLYMRYEDGSSNQWISLSVQVQTVLTVLMVLMEHQLYMQILLYYLLLAIQ